MTFDLYQSSTNERIIVMLSKKIQDAEAEFIIDKIYELLEDEEWDVSSQRGGAFSFSTLTKMLPTVNKMSPTINKMLPLKTSLSLARVPVPGAQKFISSVMKSPEFAQVANQIKEHGPELLKQYGKDISKSTVFASLDAIAENIEKTLGIKIDTSCVKEQIKSQTN
jgi:hypothetical protein